jgi:hypothetical protein
MSAVIIVKNSQGKLEGFGQAGAKTYAKFRAAVDALEIGETLQFDYKVPRAPKFHRLHFAGLIHPLFEAQEQFADETQLRKWLEVGAGHCDFVPGPKGQMVALPRSIDYASLDDVEFGEVHEACKDFMCSEHCRRFLWPHLPSDMTSKTIETILMGLEQ